MRPAPASRHHVVDRFRSRTAVDAPVAVSLHQSSARQRNPPPVGDAHETAQPDDRGNFEGVRSRMQYEPSRVTMHDFGLSAHHEHDGSAERQRGQGLERGVEQQNASLAPVRAVARHASLDGRVWTVATCLRLTQRGCRREPRSRALRSRFSVGHATTSAGFRRTVEHRPRPERTCDSHRVAYARPNRERTRHERQVAEERGAHTEHHPRGESDGRLPRSARTYRQAL